MRANMKRNRSMRQVADICTVLGVSGLATISGVIKAANKYNAEAQIDLINVPNKLECAREAANLGLI